MNRLAAEVTQDDGGDQVPGRGLDGDVEGFSGLDVGQLQAVRWPLGRQGATCLLDGRRDLATKQFTLQERFASRLSGARRVQADQKLIVARRGPPQRGEGRAGDDAVITRRGNGVLQKRRVALATVVVPGQEIALPQGLQVQGYVFALGRQAHGLGPIGGVDFAQRAGDVHHAYYRVQIAGHSAHRDGDPVTGAHVAEQIGVCFTHRQSPLHLLHVAGVVLRSKRIRAPNEQKAQE